MCAVTVTVRFGYAIFEDELEDAFDFYKSVIAMQTQRRTRACLRVQR